MEEQSDKLLMIIAYLSGELARDNKYPELEPIIKKLQEAYRELNELF